MSTSMAPKVSPSSAASQPPHEPLFEAFPEPRTCPKHWDGAALQALTKAWQSQPSSKPQA